jgi:hypothetical protein
MLIPIFAIKYNKREELNLRHCQLNKNLILTFVFDNFKKGTIAIDMKNKTSSWVKLVNDYYGNIDTDVSLFSFRNGYFVYNIQPEQLIDEIEQYLFENNCTEKDRQILKRTLSTLIPESNNVVFIGKLKNEVERKIF